MARTPSELGVLCGRLQRGEEKLVDVVKILAAESNQRIDEMINSLGPTAPPSDPLEKLLARLDLILERPAEAKKHLAEHVAATKAAREATAASIKAKADLDAHRVAVEREIKEARRAHHETLEREVRHHRAEIERANAEIATRTKLAEQRLVEASRDAREAAALKARWQKKLAFVESAA